MMIQTYSSRWLKPSTRMGFLCDAVWWPIIMFWHWNCHVYGSPFSEKAEWEWSYEGRYVLKWDCTKWLGEIRVELLIQHVGHRTGPIRRPSWNHSLEGCLLLVKRVNNHKAMNPVSITLPTCTRVSVGDFKKLNFLVLHPEKGMKPHRIRDECWFFKRSGVHKAQNDAEWWSNVQDLHRISSNIRRHGPWTYHGIIITCLVKECTTLLHPFSLM